MRFWKKKKEVQPLDIQPPAPFPEPREPAYQEQFSPPMHQPPIMPRAFQQKGQVDLQLISSKLDTIKAQLDNLNHRVAHLERIAEGE
jgi:hypothetical protein